MATEGQSSRIAAAERFWRNAAALSVLAVALAGCVSAPPPMPENAGKISQEQHSVKFLEPLYLGGPLYGSCTRALSIDGGGVRGIIPALILAEIERRTGKPIADQFDVIAGTSTGAIVALGLARPADDDARAPKFSADALVEFFKTDGGKVFREPRSPVRKLRNLVYPKYVDNGFNAMLEHYFGDVRLVEALTRVFVPAYDIEDLNQIWFDNSGNGRNLYMKDVLRGATAAPSYFPPVRLGVPPSISAKGYVALVDGGIFANDPGPRALEEARSISSTGDRSILLLSIGTGANRKKYAFDEVWKWGALEWIGPLLEIMFTDSAVEKQMKIATNDPAIKYVRLQADLENADIALDDSDPAAMAILTRVYQKLVELRKDEIDLVVQELSLPKSPQCGPKPGIDYERPQGARTHL
jgi:predicted acylesterase/phospholipase RssA